MEVIETITQASKAAAEFKPIPVKLRCGESVEVDQISWIDLPPLLERMEGAMVAGYNAYRKRELLAYTAQHTDIGSYAADAEMAHARKGKLDVEQIDALGQAAREDFAQAVRDEEAALSAAIKHVQNVPGLIEDWCAACTGQPATFWRERRIKAADVFEVVRIGWEVNYEGPVRDFFGGALRRLFGKEPEAATPESGE